MTNERRDELFMEMHSAVMTTSALVDKHDKDINGNGQPGIKERLTQVETSHNECMTRAGQQPANRSNLIALIALLVSAFACWVKAKG